MGHLCRVVYSLNRVSFDTGPVHIVAVGVLQGGSEIALQVVKSKKPKAKSDMGWDKTCAGGVCLSGTDPN